MDEDIRQLLRDKSVKAPALFESPPTVLRRARVRRATNGLAAGAVAVAVVLGGFAIVRSADPDTKISPAATIPWIDATVKPTPLAPPGPPCRDYQLDMTVRGYRDRVRGELAFAPSTPGIRCSIDKTLRVRVLDKEGRDLGVLVEGNPHLGQVDVDKGPAEAAFFLEWSPCAPTDEVTYSVDLPNGGGNVQARGPVVITQGSPKQACAGPLTLTLTGSGLTTHEELPPLYPGLETSLRVPSSVRPGETLVYFVQLGNGGDSPIVLNPCPAYSQILQRDIGDDGGISSTDNPNFPTEATSSTYLLNCKAVHGIITVGETHSFEMHLVVPTNMVPGNYSISWSLGAGAVLPAESMPITVVVS